MGTLYKIRPLHKPRTYQLGNSTLTIPPGCNSVEILVSDNRKEILVGYMKGGARATHESVPIGDRDALETLLAREHTDEKPDNFPGLIRTDGRKIHHRVYRNVRCSIETSIIHRPIRLPDKSYIYIPALCGTVVMHAEEPPFLEYINGGSTISTQRISYDQWDAVKDKLEELHDTHTIERSRGSLEK